MKVRAKETIDLSDSPEDYYFRKNPQHYDNTNGSLYKFAQDHKLNAWEFDVIKRIVRCRKKGQWLSDIDKTIKVLELYKQEYKEDER
jgi:hypothetical protein